jgi:hypothetical protein
MNKHIAGLQPEWKHFCTLSQLSSIHFFVSPLI